jgi:hypothetical protein
MLYDIYCVYIYIYIYIYIYTRERERERERDKKREIPEEPAELRNCISQRTRENAVFVSTPPYLVPMCASKSQAIVVNIFHKMFYY